MNEIEPAEAVELRPTNPLLPEGIEKFQAKCTVCSNPVPKQRVSMRTRYTCSPACLGVLQAYRRHLAKTMFCKNCQRPCTPEETKEFRAWRKHRGDLRLGPGRPVPEARIGLFREALVDALKILREARSTMDANDALATPYDERITTVEKLLDGTGEKSKLAASGQPTDGER